MMEDIKWEPVARGDIFCAPRCGFGCTRFAYDRAVREADELAARLGDGWVPHVWENLGWHYEVKHGRNVVLPIIHGGTRSGDWAVREYSAWVQGGTDEHLIQIIEKAETPEDALGFATQKARTFIADLQASLNAMLEWMPA